jgi:hypothetical protein
VLLAKAHSDLFANIVNQSGDTSEYEAAIASLLKHLGMDTTLMNGFFVALKDLIAGLNTPGCVDLEARTASYRESTYQLMRSQPGFKTFPISKKLRKDPKNSEFFALVDQAEILTRAMAENPQAPSTYFNEGTAAIFSHYMILWSQIEVTSSESSCESD